jgi:hypothetical protein
MKTLTVSINFAMYKNIGCNPVICTSVELCSPETEYLATVERMCVGVSPPHPSPPLRLWELNPAECIHQHTLHSSHCYSFELFTTKTVLSILRMFYRCNRTKNKFFEASLGVPW